MMNPCLDIYEFTTVPELMKKLQELVEQHEADELTFEAVVMVGEIKELNFSRRLNVGDSSFSLGELEPQKILKSSFLSNLLLKFDEK